VVAHAGKRALELVDGQPPGRGSDAILHDTASRAGALMQLCGRRWRASTQMKTFGNTPIDVWLPLGAV